MRALMTWNPVGDQVSITLLSADMARDKANDEKLTAALKAWAAQHPLATPRERNVFVRGQLEAMGYPVQLGMTQVCACPNCMAIHFDLNRGSLN